jgi:hypothetical protein
MNLSEAERKRRVEAGKITIRKVLENLDRKAIAPKTALSVSQHWKNMTHEQYETRCQAIRKGRNADKSRD